MSDTSCYVVVAVLCVLLYWFVYQPESRVVMPVFAIEDPVQQSESYKATPYQLVAYPRIYKVDTRDTYDNPSHESMSGGVQPNHPARESMSGGVQPNHPTYARFEDVEGELLPNYSPAVKRMGRVADTTMTDYFTEQRDMSYVGTHDAYADTGSVEEVDAFQYVDRSIRNTLSEPRSIIKVPADQRDQVFL